MHRGKDGTTPSFVTAMAPVTIAKRTAHSIVSPWARATARPALKASPAPVVSAACTEIAGKCFCSSALINSAPFSPSVMTTCFTPRRRSISAMTFGSIAASAARPANTLASVSFGVSTSTRARTEGERLRTGAGLRIVTAPADRPRAKALSAVVTGISN